MSQLVRLEGKHTTQSAHCAMWPRNQKHVHTQQGNVPKVRNLDLNNFTIPEHLSRHSGYFPARSRGQCGQLLTSSPPSKSSCCRPCHRSWADARSSWGRSPWRPWAAPATWPGPGCPGTRWWSSSIRRCGPGLCTLAIWVEDLDGGWSSSSPGIPGSPIGFLWSRSGHQHPEDLCLITYVGDLQGVADILYVPVIETFVGK